MNPIMRNGLALIAGIILGGALNMAIVTIGPYVIPNPEGTDVTTPEGLKLALPLMQPQHFVFPFLAHALGTFVGAFATIFFSASKKQYLSWVVGFWFLMGGVALIIIVPFPLWIILVDILFAYLPMAWLGWKLAGGVKR